MQHADSSLESETKKNEKSKVESVWALSMGSMMAFKERNMAIRYIHTCLYTEPGAYVNIRKSKLALISFRSARLLFITIRTSNKKERQVAMSIFRNTRHYTRESPPKTAMWMVMRRAQREREARKTSVMKNVDMCARLSR